MAADMEHGSFFFSVIKGIQKIKGMGAEKAAYAKWAENYREILHYDYNRPFFVKYQGTLLGALATCTTFTLMGVAAMHDITRENYLIFTSSYAMILSVANSLTGIMNSIFRMRTLSDNIRPIFSYGDKTKEMKEYVQSLHGSIKVENVHFAYEGNQRGCVRGVSLELKPGEKIAFVGESGCGKSTLLKIILGMEKADEGTVYFDGKNIDQLNQKSLRQHIGSIFQFSKLFPGTIFANVSFGSAHEVSEEDVWQALDQACIGDYVRGLPLQLNTEITESNSCGFSGGQRQRLLIARALVGKPKVLIFDEATSALDNVTQKKVLDTVVELLTVQYRMHRDIMQFSSDWFYHGRLTADPECAERTIVPIDPPLIWIDTANLGYEEEQNSLSQSRLNTNEGILLVETLKLYINEIGKKRLLDERVDFGIISPYKSQVQLLRRLIKHEKELKQFLPYITVNTVDGFQGQERDVILISMVRGNDEGRIGFLNDLRRMNVAITRARMKLIILGDTSTLSKTRFYRKLIEHVTRNGQMLVIPGMPKEEIDQPIQEKQ